MDNDTSFPLGYYIEVTTDYAPYKGRIVAYDNEFLVIDALPGEASVTNSAGRRVPLPGARYWVQRSRAYHIVVAPSPLQPQGREGEAEPARGVRADVNDRWTAAFNRLAQDYRVNNAPVTFDPGPVEVAIPDIAIPDA